MRFRRPKKGVAAAMGRWARLLLAMVFSVGLTFFAFLVLPLLEQVSQGKSDSVEIRQVGSASLEPPPPPTVEEEKPKEEAPPPPPEIGEEAPPLDLSQLELALNPGFGDGVGGDFALKLPGSGSRAEASQDSDDIFSAADLDQAPRLIQQTAPEYPAALKKRKLQGTVHVLFIVDKSGRVQKPMVQKSSDIAFEEPALRAIRRWRFEPGKRKGAAVESRMLIPITFLPG